MLHSADERAVRVVGRTFDTSEELRSLSDTAHRFEGILLLFVASAAAGQAVGLLAAGVLGYVWPLAVVVAALALPPYVLLRHGASEPGRAWPVMRANPQLRQHLVLAALLFVGGSSELAAVARRTPALGIGWSAALALMGVVFLVHKQHGTHESVALAARTHRLSAAALLVAAALSASSLIIHPGLASLWPVALAAAGGLLLAYHEPPGAFEGSGLTTHYMYE